jgi:hypothetical protein
LRVFPGVAAMIRKSCLHLRPYPYLHLNAGVLPPTVSSAHNPKYCLEIRFRTPLSILISIYGIIRITKKSDLPLDLRPDLPHIAPRFSKQYD